MSEPAFDLTPDLAADPAPSADARALHRARAALLKRLADVCCLPSSRVNAFERAMTADLLVEMLREAAVEERARVARRLANLTEVPATLARLLLRDRIEVARALLENCPTLGECDLVDCVRYTTQEHRRLIAMRRGLGEVVCETLVEGGEPAVVEAILKNDQAALSAPAVEMVTAMTRDHPRFIPLLLRRPELRPSHAYAMFWWSDGDCRKVILQRFAVSREILQDAASDVFELAAAEGWQDPLARKALQFIERRQRNRAAVEKSRFNSLDEAVTAAQDGLTTEIAEEISHLSGLKPMTGAKIFADLGGEPVAILCKATGLPRQAIQALWRGMHRPEADNGVVDATLERVINTYDMIAVDRAQTVLRYWNWSLSSAMTPALIKAIRDGADEALDEYSVPERTAMLVLSRELGH